MLFSNSRAPFDESKAISNTGGPLVERKRALGMGEGGRGVSGTNNLMLRLRSDICLLTSHPPSTEGPKGTCVSRRWKARNT